MNNQELQSAKEREERAKNEAYSFILMKGLYGEFEEYVKDLRAARVDPMDVCRRVMEKGR